MQLSEREGRSASAVRQKLLVRLLRWRRKEQEVISTLLVGDRLILFIVFDGDGRKGAGLQDLLDSAPKDLVVFDEFFAVRHQARMVSVNEEECWCYMAAQSATGTLVCVYMYVHSVKILTDMAKSKWT